MKILGLDEASANKTSRFAGAEQLLPMRSEQPDRLIMR